MAYKEYFGVFCWVTPNQRQAGQEIWILLPGFRMTLNQRLTGQVTWVRLQGFGITPNRVT